MVRSCRLGPAIELYAYLVDTALGNVVVNDFPGFSKVMVLNFGPLANGSKRDIVSYRTLDETGRGPQGHLLVHF